jgi:ASC-1-like (ASCH) protein
MSLSESGKTIKTILPEPWFSLVCANKKTIYGTLCKSKFKNLNKNDIIEFTNKDLGFIRSIRVKVKNINYYDSFNNMLKSEDGDKSLPYVNGNINKLKIYNKTYNIKDQNEYGVIAVSIILI